MDDPKQQVIDRIKQANNVLVSVSANPSVDQLASCIALTLMLNKLGKHGTAVFSGAIPSTIEFLKPEDTLEKNTDSLRDFIIALDKSKADKLRYKVEDKVVKIFITPYRTSLGEKDLEFSQGDFNIDAVVALGVHEQADLDQAITAHGRILHDATAISINYTADNSNLGSINWQDTSVSSLSELIAQLGLDLDKNVLDAQIATALLTGIVAATNRFSNDKTSSKTMSISAQLVTAGANPKLVATQLEEAAPEPEPPKVAAPLPPPAPIKAAPKASVAKTADDGTLNIKHDDTDGGQIDIDSQGVIHRVNDQPPAGPGTASSAASAPPQSQPFQPAPTITMPEPESLSSKLTANSQPEGLDPITDPLSLPSTGRQLLSRDNEPGAPDNTLPTIGPIQTSSSSTGPSTPAPNPSGRPDDAAQSGLDDARSAVQAAMAAGPVTEPPSPIAALNAQPVFENLNADNLGAGESSPTSTMSHHTVISPPSEAAASEAVAPTLDMPLPSAPFNPAPPANGATNTPPSVSDGFAPPPVPPPMMPTFGPGPSPTPPAQ